MFKRFSDSLFNPKEISDYQYDKRYITILYFLLLVFISILPSISYVFTNNGFDYEDQKLIRNAFKNKEIPYELVNYQLVKKGTYDKDFYEVDLIPNVLKVVLTDQDHISKDNKFNTTTVILFTKTSVYIQQSLMETVLFEYNQYTDLENLDLSLAGNDDINFWQKIFTIINNQLKIYSPYILIVNLLIVIFTGVFDLLLFTLLIAMFQRITVRGLIKYQKLWKMSIYTITPYVITVLLGNLFSLGFLPFIGIFISIYYASVVTRKLLENH